MSWPQTGRPHSRPRGCLLRGQPAARSLHGRRSQTHGSWDPSPSSGFEGPRKLLLTWLGSVDTPLEERTSRFKVGLPQKFDDVFQKMLPFSSCPAFAPCPGPLRRQPPPRPHTWGTDPLGEAGGGLWVPRPPLLPAGRQLCLWPQASPVHPAACMCVRGGAWRELGPCAMWGRDTYTCVCHVAALVHLGMCVRVQREPCLHVTHAGGRRGTWAGLAAGGLAHVGRVSEVP